MKSILTRYDEIARKHTSHMVSDQKWFLEQLREKNCSFGPKLVPSFLKPCFVSQHEEDNLKVVVKHLTSMLNKAIAAYFRYPELRPLYSIPKRIKSLVEMDPGFKKTIVISRPDAFAEHGVYRFIEFNCDSPAGAGYTDVQEEILKQTFPLKRLARSYAWKKSNRLKSLLKALLECYVEYGGKKKSPHIAIIDWKHVKTRPEFEILKTYFESCGYPTVVCDPRELKFRRNKLFYKEFKVDLIYRRAIINELMEHRKDVKDFFRAYAMGKVCVVNPLRSKIAANKSILSIITNPAYNYFFSADEIKTRDKHIPWTRLVVDAKKFYGGRNIYLSQMIDENQNDLVLKPTGGYGGVDVKIGKETSKAEWRRTIKRALHGGDHWVVQEYVNIPNMTVPIFKKGRLSLKPKKININPYVFGGRYSGALVRLSDALVINVSAGGGLVPSITYRKR